MNPCVLLAAQELAETPADGGPIETFVIGVGDYPSTDDAQFNPAFLGNVALAGGTAPKGLQPGETTSRRTSAIRDRSVESQTASQLQMKFETALDAIRGEVASCTYPLQSTGLGQIDPALVNVEVNGKTVLQDPMNGWAYDDPAKPSAVVLDGAACTAAMAAGATVQIVVGCATQAVQ